MIGRRLNAEILPDLRGKLSKVTKMGEAVARLPLKMKAKFLYQKDELSSPLLEKVKKID